MARKPRRKSDREGLVPAICGLPPPQWYSRWSALKNADWSPQVLCWTLLVPISVIRTRRWAGVEWVDLHAVVWPFLAKELLLAIWRGLSWGAE